MQARIAKSKILANSGIRIHGPQIENVCFPKFCKALKHLIKTVNRQRLHKANLILWNMITLQS